MAKQPRDLVERTFRFALNVRRFVNLLPKKLSNYEDARQMVRSPGSVAGNYREAQEGVNRKDFFFRSKVCREEARESGLWRRLVDVGDGAALAKDRNGLAAEADELRRNFAAIAGKDDSSDAG